jgi:predicted O-methyltransferase YrrM
MTSLSSRITSEARRILSGAKRYQYLFETIDQKHCRRIMEIGTWNGQRALQMIERAKTFHPADQIEYYGFDLFELMTKEVNKEELSKKPPPQDEVRKLLAATGARISLYQGFTTETLPQVVRQLPAMDLIFIDGGHSLETIANDWNYSLQLMDKNTVVIFDDYYYDRDDVGAKPIVEKIDPNEYDVMVLPRRDRFFKTYGVLSINFVKVEKKALSS